MGAGRKAPQAKYYDVLGSEFVSRTDEHNKSEWARQRELKKGKYQGQLIWEEPYDYLEGAIKDIEVRKHDNFGNQLIIKIVDGDEEMIIRTSFSGRYSNTFCKKLPNIDLNLEIRFQPYSFKPEGQTKNVSGFALYQNGNKIEDYHTKETPNGLPQPLKRETSEGIKWDFEPQLIFFKESIAKFADQLNTPAYLDDSNDAEEVTDDDLPF